MAEATQAGGSPKPVIPQVTEPEIEVVEEGEETQRAAPAAAEGETAGTYEYPEGEEQGDARTGHAQQETAGGEAGDASLTPEQLTARQRRRAREKEARNRERSDLIRLRQENEQLRANQQRLDSRVANVEISGIDGQIQALEGEVAKANSVMKRAMEAQNGEDFVRAQEFRDVFRDRLNGLKKQKDDVTKAAKPNGGDVQAPNGLTTQQVQFARIFVQRHPWYKQDASDEDSRSVQQIDNEMVAQGLNPSTPEYWLELERRVRSDVPHKFKAANDEPDKQTNGRVPPANRSGGPRLPGGGGGGGGGAGGGPVKFHLSKERKEALITMGVYDDPEKRMKHIKSFIRWDKDNPVKK